jgi:hypothetical protein
MLVCPILAGKPSENGEQHPQSDGYSDAPSEPRVSFQTVTHPARRQSISQGPSVLPGSPPAGATGEDVIHMHNELIRGEPVERKLLGELARRKISGCVCLRSLIPALVDLIVGLQLGTQDRRWR